MQLPISHHERIKTTTSLCPVCKSQISAEVIERDEKVFLKKTCDSHGSFEVLINSDRRYYYESCGAGGACQCAADHSQQMVEHASTCIALIEIVETCNIKCPTCYASSEHTRPEDVRFLDRAEIRNRVLAVIDRKGPLDILQLSGGEPTIHPQFVDVLEDAVCDPQIGYVLINTNGVRLASDESFARAIGDVHSRRRKCELYLQFDGTQTEGQLALRGADYRLVRERAIARAAEHGIPVTLAMTVTPETITFVGDAIRFGLSDSTIRGITLQPAFGSGRFVESGLVTIGATQNQPPRRLNVADMIHALIAQSEGLLCDRDFTPLPCGDPNCHTIGYLIRRGGKVMPVSRLIDFESLQGFLQDRVNFNMDDLSQCGCESEPLGRLLKSLEVGPDDVFRIFIKPFMDVWTYDQDRIDRCCVHVVGPNGELESFCRHYALQS